MPPAATRRKPAADQAAVAYVQQRPPHDRRTVRDAIAEAQSATKGRLWRPSEIAAKHGLPHWTVYRLIASGALPASRVYANRLVIADADLRRYLRSLKRQGG